ncbi:MAG: hypothetical protein ACXW3Z_04615 [Limisphaerales bacterium]
MKRGLVVNLASVFNADCDASPVRITDAASFLLRVTWQDISMISVEEGLLTIRFHYRPAFSICAEIQDIPNLIGLIRAK